MTVVFGDITLSTPFSEMHNFAVEAVGAQPRVAIEVVRVCLEHATDVRAIGGRIFFVVIDNNFSNFIS